MRIGMVLALMASLAAGMAQAEQRTVTVTGLGEVAAVPDMAVITVGASHQGKTPEEAMEQVNAAVSAVLERLSAAGIAPRDVQTSGLSLNPVYDHRSYEEGGRRLVGFAAANRVTIRVRDLDAVGGILGELVEVGANDIDGISFALQDSRALQDQARRDAVADARAKAELYADAAGVKLGRLITLTEQGGPSPRPEMMRVAAMSDAAPVAPGELTVRATVVMIWEIAEE